MQFIQKEGFQVAGLIDGDRCKQEKEILVTVFPPELFVEKKEGCKLVVTSQPGRFEIVEHLKNLEVQAFRGFCCLLLTGLCSLPGRRRNMRKGIARYCDYRKKWVPRERRSAEYLINKYYGDVVAVFVVRLAYALKLTPNMLTVASLCFGAAAAGFLLTHNWTAAAVFLQMHYFFDLADGTLARLTQKNTPFGAKLDSYSDQAVRLILFLSIAVVAKVPFWVKVFFISTIYMDTAVVHLYVLPFMKKHRLVRAHWKQWFLDRGIIPGFDIFTVFFLITVFAVAGRLDILVYVVIAGKNLDWLYRVWECWKTGYLRRATEDSGSWREGDD